MSKKLLAAGLLMISVGGTVSGQRAKVAPPISPAGETITWEARVLRASGPEVVAGGVKTYAREADIVVREGPEPDGKRVPCLQTLYLDDTFALSASVGRTPILSGFGLLVSMRSDHKGFSWEWFDLEQGTVFRKRQGNGHVSVTVNKGELQSVEFLDDIVLRYQDDMSKPPGTHTHEVIVRKGSVFRLVPYHAATDGPYSVGNGVTPPVFLSQPPSYTDEALQARIEGTVLIQCIIRKNGKPSSFWVLKGLGYGLDEKAIDIIRDKWRFKPGTYNGVPVDVEAMITVSFKLYK